MSGKRARIYLSSPAPWENQPSLDGGHSRQILGTDERGQWVIASVNLCMGSESEANAHLIAAAPDLFAALERLYGKLLMSDRDGEARITEEDGEMARAALAKAKGER